MTAESVTTLTGRKESVPSYLEKPLESMLQLDYEKAIDSLNSLIKATPNNNELIYYRAWIHYINGQMFNAFEDIDFYLRQSPLNEYFGYILLGKIQFERLASVQSSEAFDKAIALEPQKAFAYLEKSRMYAYTQNFEIGTSFVEKWMKRFRNEIDFYLYRGMLYSSSNEPKKAIGDFNTYISSPSPKNSINLKDAYLYSGKSYLMSGDLENALVQTNLALEISPESYVGYGLRGEIEFKMKDYESSLRDFTKFEEKMQSTSYWNMLGALYEMKGDLEKACGYYSGNCKQFFNKEACSKQKNFDVRNESGERKFVRHSALAASEHSSDSKIVI